ncbi:MAG: hypothetical protein DCC71_23560, partial [Proteobacteria bacterium]
MSDAPRAAARRSFDPAVPLLVLLVAALHAFHAARELVPIHDSFYTYVNFHVFYSHWLYEGELVEWYPYGALGLPAPLQLVISFTPLQYLVGFAGALLGARDTLSLYALSVFGEHALFAAGAYLCARRLFPSRASAVAIGVAAAGSVVWWTQGWFELRFFYLLPLVLACALDFLDTRRPSRFWLTGAACVAWTMGNMPYFAGVWALVLVLVLGAPLVAARSAWRSLLAPAPSNLLAMALFAVPAAALVYVGAHAFDGVVMREEGRYPGTGAVPLNVFLTYGGNAEIGALVRGALRGWPVQLPWGTGMDTSAYVGLLPLAACALALVRERSRLWIGMLVAAVVLVLLSFGGAVAKLAYHVPGVSLFRHIGLVYGLVKCLAILGAGFGLEGLWRLRAAGRGRAAAAGVAAAAAVACA